MPVPASETQFTVKAEDQRTHTNTAIGQFTVKAEDQRTGKPVNRRVAVIAISVWYEEPAASTSPTAKCM
jgi:hypothetical protein